MLLHNFLKPTNCYANFFICLIVGDQLQILEYILKVKGGTFNVFTSRHCHAAARAGHCRILQWLHANGVYTIDIETCTNAILGGHFDALHVLIQGCPKSYFSCASAARGGHMEVQILLSIPIYTC